MKVNRDGYFRSTVNGKRKLTHVIVAEAALGKPLPPGAQVHHVDLHGDNNANSNLVICQDGAYHKLLHVRTHAMNACGNPNWRRCQFCREYDDPTKMYNVKGRQDHFHRECQNKHKRDIRRAVGLKRSPPSTTSKGTHDAS